jgi:hypothetical protein
MLTLVGLVANPQSAPGEHPNNAALCNQREAVKSYCRSLDGKLKSLRQRTFGAPFPDEDTWREVSGDYEGIMAHVFTRNGTAVVAGFGFSSESGDWALDATYYYRTNGTLAKKHELLKTFTETPL